MFDERNRFVIRDYQSKPPFSSFLPGIAGELGIPLWCYYNNRGQGVCSFGARDKDHAIMEFSPAHVAYRDVSRTGFRTFCKLNGTYQELFTESCNMHIGMSELEITAKKDGLLASALYFAIPGERTAALCRTLTITNTGDSALHLEILDGMPAVVPYGLNQDFLKNMTQLSKAWMQAEDYTSGKAYFRVRASLEDSAIVREVTGGNFCLGWDESSALLKPLVQPSLVFGEDTALEYAKAFQKESLNVLTEKTQYPYNQVLCCFFPKVTVLKPGESARIHSIYGQAESKQAVAEMIQNIHSVQWFDAKRNEATELVASLVKSIHCKTADPVFDAYAKQTYLDNLLRGGAPIMFRSKDKCKPFHIYSRKHGDPEREYNYFSLGMEYYAQGNGNYRDVNQNRRCDVLFCPEIKDANIFTFFDLIQSDGYNPLVLIPGTYTLSEEQYKLFAAKYPQLSCLLAKPFTPGQLAMAAEDAKLPDIQGVTAEIICESSSEPNADFGEGYWCDHWTYNLDLIESYLSVYPEQKNALLFTENTCRWYETRVLVNPRNKRYCMTGNGLRQYYALDEKAKTAKTKWMQLSDQEEARSSLMEKMLFLCAIKTATLDAAGMGIEMEGGRPGWYDALNGLPGLLGSSMAETCELARLIAFVKAALEQHPGSLYLYDEIAELLEAVHGILCKETEPFSRWNAMNSTKEAYREKTLYGFTGNRRELSCTALSGMLSAMEEAVLSGIEKAIDFTGGVIPTYFTYEAEKVEGNLPLALKPSALPLFLEGPVRYLKLPLGIQTKQALAAAVRDSGLYDRKLSMYKVNESLSTVSYEAGRALAFTPGWLENESVWLHMEYKYLLELLKSGLYPEFSEAFRNAAVPFLDPDIYGRSPLENVSFIASSANPDPDVHGRGFVARLSGSTAEFIHIWQILFFGCNPFRMEHGKLTLRFEPFIPEYLMNQALETTFLGSVSVTYDTGNLKALIPGITKVAGYMLTFRDGTTKKITENTLGENDALAVRNGDVARIHVIMSE